MSISAKYDESTLVYNTRVTISCSGSVILNLAVGVVLTSTWSVSHLCWVHSDGVTCRQASGGWSTAKSCITSYAGTHVILLFFLVCLDGLEIIFESRTSVLDQKWVLECYRGRVQEFDLLQIGLVLLFRASLTSLLLSSIDLRNLRCIFIDSLRHLLLIL